MLPLDLASNDAVRKVSSESIRYVDLDFQNRDHNSKMPSGTKCYQFVWQVMARVSRSYAQLENYQLANLKTTSWPVGFRIKVTTWDEK